MRLDFSALIRLVFNAPLARKELLAVRCQEIFVQLDKDVLSMQSVKSLLKQ